MATAVGAVSRDGLVTAVTEVKVATAVGAVSRDGLRLGKSGHGCWGGQSGWTGDSRWVKVATAVGAVGIDWGQP